MLHSIKTKLVGGISLLTIKLQSIKRSVSGRRLSYSVLALVALGALLSTFVFGFSPEITSLVVTAMVSVGTVLYSKQRETQQEIEQEHRKQKIPVYEDFTGFFMRVAM